MIDNFDTILYLNEEKLKDRSIIDIAGLNSEKEVYFTLEKDENGVLPIGLAIYKKSMDDKLVYGASITNWRYNPRLLDRLFNFQPRETDTRVKLEPKN